ncbi:MAG: cytochrome C oxidase subunit IV family protein [Euryarchaeota archaeon]|mgnify:FL=1|jgi:hypothetical protein|nr:cytochrome C oxidase subunit IV family protein [Euryarchaeota archaeon]MBT7244541.1 cytochrome C oxidase subunit IV family protein [Euryarchaeota archaeon]
MSEHKYTGPIAGIFQKMADLIGKDVYYVNFLILMFFTLFEIAAVFFETVPGTDIEITRDAVWAILIVVGIIKGYGIAAFFMHLKGDPFIYTRTALFPILFAALMLWGIGLSNPDGIDGLPSWCTPNYDYSYVTD